MKFLSQWILSCFLIIVFCPRSFSQAIECEKAASSCIAQCGQLQVQDMNGDNYPQGTNFKEKCETSCSNGLHNCQLQDSWNACDTFYFHCAEACPWTVVDKYDDLTIRDSNSFSQCVKACGEGGNSCRTTGQSPRKRTGSFDACVEAQEACYSDCGFEPWDVDEYGSIANSDYPSKCSKACFTGVAPCQAMSMPRKCEEYFKQCDLACPDSVTDQEGNVHSVEDSVLGCHDSCEKGEDYCNNILK